MCTSPSVRRLALLEPHVYIDLCAAFGVVLSIPQGVSGGGVAGIIIAILCVLGYFFVKSYIYVVWQSKGSSCCDPA